MEGKKAVMLMAYGSPERVEDIEPYYTNIRGGRKPSPQELNNLIERYNLFGGKSPLLKFTLSTAQKLEKKLGGMKVYAGMKHWHPFISEVFEEINRDAVTNLLTVALAPHFSKMSIAGYQDSVNKANLEYGGKVKITSVNEWHLNPVFLDKWSKRISAALEKFNEPKKDIFFLFSAHSLPEKILSWKDPYRDQLYETMNALATKLSLEKKQFGFAFQSAGHTSDPWLGPDILDKLKELKNSGWKSVLVAPIVFVSDHLEILFDIDVEARDLAKEIGVHLERTESFNDSDDFVDIIASVVGGQSDF